MISVDGFQRSMWKMSRSQTLRSGSKIFLNNAGMRPINLIVDVTNFVMLRQDNLFTLTTSETSQGQKSLLRLANKNETLTTLDEQKRSLNSNDIVIADKDRAIGLAGVMGGADSEVQTRHKRDYY